jgi:hypothetical protein
LNSFDPKEILEIANKIDVLAIFMITAEEVSAAVLKEWTKLTFLPLSYDAKFTSKAEFPYANRINYDS